MAQAKMNIAVVDASNKYETGRDANGNLIDRMDNGRLTRMAKKALEAAKAEGKLFNIKVTTDIIFLHKVMPRVGFHPGNYDHLPKAIIPTFKKLLKADAIIFTSAVQWYSMNAAQKSFIEHLTALEYGPELLAEHFPGFDLKEGRQLSGKHLGVLVSCNEDGGQQVANSIVAPLSDMRAKLVAGGMLYQNSSNKEGGEDGWQLLPEVVGENIVRQWGEEHGIELDNNDWEAREAA